MRRSHSRNWPARVAISLLALLVIACSGPKRPTPTPPPVADLATPSATTASASAFTTAGPTGVRTAPGSPGATPTRDALAGIWAEAGEMATARAGHTASLLPNGLVLVTGGVASARAGAQSLASAELYDPQQDRWLPTGSLGDGRMHHTATVLANGQLLVVGGETSLGGGSRSLASAELFDPATNSWRPAGQLTLARGGHSATLLPDGRVLVIGGESDRDAPIGARPAAEVYDPATNEWTPLQPMATDGATSANTSFSRRHHTATMLANGRLLIAGGEPSRATDGGADLLATAGVYDPSANTWTRTGDLTAGRGGHTATLLPDGKILVVGGQTGGARGYRAEFAASRRAPGTADLFDPATNQWSPAAAPVEERSSHTATALGDGRLLVVGGDGQTGADVAPLASAERYDPAAGVWTSFRMTTPRSRHAAVLLPDGTVLVTGGASGKDGVQATAERFLPGAVPVPPPAIATTVAATATPRPRPTPTPTNTPVPPTPTSTPEPPTATPVPPTATAVPPSPTAAPARPTLTTTPTPRPPPPTNTPAPARTGTIVGTVTYCANTCAPVDGAKVNAGGVSATTDKAGNYVLAGVPAGDQVVSVSYRGNARQTVRVPPGGSVRADFTLR